MAKRKYAFTFAKLYPIVKLSMAKRKYAFTFAKLYPIVKLSMAKRKYAFTFAKLYPIVKLSMAQNKIKNFTTVACARGLLDLTPVTSDQHVQLQFGFVTRKLSFEKVTKWLIYFLHQTTQR
jgi:hypothetical protein